MGMNSRILMVEDDRSISSMVKEYLDSEGFLTDVFSCGKAAVQALFDGAGSAYALVLIDLMLPDMSGMDVIKAIRRDSLVPIIILTAKDNDKDKSLGLNLGADDYVVKPFSLIELTARIRANIRRAVSVKAYSAGVGRDTEYKDGKSISDDLIRFRDLEINVTRHTVRAGGVMVELTRTEFEILSLLASHPGQAFSKERLYERIWKEPYFGNENVLNTHVNRLRAKLKAASGEGAAYIKTLWGIGYKMEEV